jgi:Ca-activated chloride channel homolog
LHVTAHLDLDVIAVETDNQLSVLVEVAAPPTLHTGEAHPAATLQVVLDRSGSMSGARLDGAKAALVALVDRLSPTDNFGLVTFDDQVQTVVPTMPLQDRARVKRVISALQAGGMTDLSAGYLRGLQHARNGAGPAGATLLLVSDGHANAGVTDPGQLAAVAAKGHQDGIVTSTLGFGLGYDERLLNAIAKGGQGNELFAEDPDTAGALIAGEVDELLTQSALAASVLIRPCAPATRAMFAHETPTIGTRDGFVTELGNLYAGETRKLVVVFEVLAIESLGLAKVADLEFRWVELPTLLERTVSIPIHVNVVPDAEACAHLPDPTVRTELAYLQIQQAKQDASGQLAEGDLASALAALERAHRLVTDALASAPPELHDDLIEEAQALRYLGDQARMGAVARAAKFSSVDAAAKSRKRGRERADRDPASPEQIVD